MENVQGLAAVPPKTARTVSGEQILVGAFALILLAFALVAAGAIHFFEAVPA